MRLLSRLNLKRNIRYYTPDKPKKLVNGVLTPKEIYKGLSEYVIGQHDVKVALSVGIHNHLVRSMFHVTKPPKETKSTAGPPEFIPADLSFNLALGTDRKLTAQGLNPSKLSE